MKARGATLIELIITCAVFALLSIASFTVMKMGITSQRAVQTRTDVQGGLRRLESDMGQEIRRASLRSLGIYTTGNDYRWAIWFKTSMNDPADVTAAGNPTSVGDSIQMITDPNANPVPQRYVLYYVGLMGQQEHIQTFGDDGIYSSLPIATGPETTCPHKWIIKKEIALTTDGSPWSPTNPNDSIGLPGALTLSHLTRYLTDGASLGGTWSRGSLLQESVANVAKQVSEPTNVARVQIMCENVVSFELARLVSAGAGGSTAQPISSATGPIILFDVKVMKNLDAQQHVTVGFGRSIVSGVGLSTADSNGVSEGGVQPTAGPTPSSGNAGIAGTYASGSVVGTYAPYTFQLDNRVIPENP